MKTLFKLIVFFFLFVDISNADLIKPNSNLKPFDVLMIQLNSLKNNNNPYIDAGIEQTWELAHPINKTSTGPLERFKQMIYSESYKILISHENNKIIILKESAKKFVYKVYVLSKDKKRYYYIRFIGHTIVYNHSHVFLNDYFTPVVDSAAPHAEAPSTYQIAVAVFVGTHRGDRFARLVVDPNSTAVRVRTQRHQLFALP